MSKNNYSYFFSIDQDGNYRKCIMSNWTEISGYNLREYCEKSNPSDSLIPLHAIYAMVGDFEYLCDINDFVLMALFRCIPHVILFPFIFDLIDIVFDCYNVAYTCFLTILVLTLYALTAIIIYNIGDELPLHHK